MQDQATPIPNQTTTSNPVSPQNVVASNDDKSKPKQSSGDEMRGIIEKIAQSENILVALSSSPSVDEIAAAIGLTLYLDKAGKHVTAIYSGETPNVLQFLKPEETFETNTDSLQDFIVALNKEKADHLRYKIDGDYVKVYITPYKTTIDEDDLEFSHGDYNVDLVIAVNVPTPSDLDGALSEHGRIMHDATAVDITANEPGRFGEIEWSDATKSSVSEMAANLILAVKKPPMEKTVATALLAGIVSATNRFSNENTTPEALTMGAKLMELGADQQLVTLNLIENSPLELIGEVDVAEKKKKADPTTLEIDHAPEEEKVPEHDDAEIAQTAADAMSAAGVVVPPNYSQMMTEALAEPLPSNVDAEAVRTEAVENPATAMTPSAPTGVEANGLPVMDYAQVPTSEEMTSAIVPETTNEFPTSADVMANNGIMAGEQPAALGADSYLVESPTTEFSEDMTGDEAAPTSVVPEQSANPPQENATTSSLPMPDATGVTLPPPPAPTVDFNNIVPMDAAMPKVVETPTMDAAGSVAMPSVPTKVAASVNAESTPADASAATPTPTSPGTFQIPNLPPM